MERLVLLESRCLEQIRCCVSNELGEQTFSVVWYITHKDYRNDSANKRDYRKAQKQCGPECYNDKATDTLECNTAIMQRQPLLRTDEKQNDAGPKPRSYSPE